MHYSRLVIEPEPEPPNKSVAALNYPHIKIGGSPFWVQKPKIWNCSCGAPMAFVCSLPKIFSTRASRAARSSQTVGPAVFPVSWPVHVYFRLPGALRPARGRCGAAKRLARTPLGILTAAYRNTAGRGPALERGYDEGCGGRVFPRNGSGCGALMSYLLRKMSERRIGAIAGSLSGCRHFDRIRRLIGRL